MEKKRRADTQRTRDKLLDSLGRLIERHGLDVSMPDIARETGVSTATVYRHFDAVDELRQAFYARAVSNLLTDLDAISQSHAGLKLFEAVCERWFEHMEDWAVPAAMIRSAKGYLERYQAQDPLIAEHYKMLEKVLQQLIDIGFIPDQDHDSALLMWITLFDERVYLDLRRAKGMTPVEAGHQLSQTVLGVLRSPVKPSLAPPGESLIGSD